MPNQHEATAAAQYAAHRFGLLGKRCLVTGGTKGIGKAIVEELCSLGAQVYTCSRNVQELQAVLEEWHAKGFNVQGSAADVSDEAQRSELLEKVKAAFNNELHVLVNNVGTNVPYKAAVEHSPQEFDTVMRTNLQSSFALCQLCHPLLKSSGDGCIIFISSVAGGPTVSRAGPLYAMSKAAMNQLAKNLAVEWADDGIRVNSVAPWVTLTELGMNNLKDEKWKAGVLERTPLGRLERPADVSGVVAFLCSPAASYMTGHTMPVDGGYSVKGFW